MFLSVGHQRKGFESTDLGYFLFTCYRDVCDLAVFGQTVVFDQDSLNAITETK